MAHLRLSVLGVLLVLVGGCGDQGSGLPAIDEAGVAAAEAKFVVLDAEAKAFDELRSGDADSGAVTAFVEASYSPEIVFDDVTFGQYDEGSDAVARMYRTFLFYMDEASISHRPYILSDTTAVSVIDFWDVTLGPTTFTEDKPLVEVDVMEVTDAGTISSNVLFYDKQSLMSIFGTEDRLFGLVERYVSAWNTGDSSEVGALYTEQATRHDGLARIDAADRSDIEAEAERWFTALPEASWETVVPFAQQDGDRAGVVFDVVDDACPVAVAVVWEVNESGQIEKELVHYDPTTLRTCEWLGR